MYILKNAFRTIGRTKGRNILIGIIVLVIAISCCISLSIRQAAASAKESGLEALQITASLSIDRQAMMQNAQRGGDNFREMLQGSQDLSLEELQTYAESQYVKSFYYSTTASFNGSDDIEAVTTSSSSTDSSTEDAATAANQPPGMEGGADSGRMSSPPGGMGSEGDFTITGYSSQTAMTAFVEGTRYISAGEM